MVTGTALGQGHKDPPGSCTRLAATGSVWSLPPAQSCCLWGEQPQGSLVVDVCLQEPKADNCLLAGTLTVYRKTTSCFDLRDRRDKPILVTPKNPRVRMRHHPGIPWALVVLHPPNPASNKSALPLPSWWDARCLHFLRAYFQHCLTPRSAGCLQSCKAGRRAVAATSPQCCPSGSHSGFTSLSKSLVSSVPAPC